MTDPYYSDESVTIYNCDVAEAPIDEQAVVCLIGSPPYNVGIQYDVHLDMDPWAAYAERVHDWCHAFKRVLAPGARTWVNVAPVVQQPEGEAGPHSGRTGKSRFSLARCWADQLEDTASLAPCDQIAWTSLRGSGSAWGSWASPSAPNLRGDWELILLHYVDTWARTAPAGYEGYKDPDNVDWTSLVSNVWAMATTRRDDHPAAFPEELPRRCIRLSTWPTEVVLDPWCGSGTTLKAARDLGRRSIGCDISERYCEIAARRASQAVLL